MRVWWHFHVIILLIITALAFMGCSDHSSDTIKPEKMEFNLGQAINQSIKTYLSQSENAQAKLQIYTLHEAQIVSSINSLVSNTQTKTAGAIDPITQPILKALYQLVENNTLPQATNASGHLLQEIGKDPKTVQALCDFFNSRNGIDVTNALALVHKVLNHESSDELWQALAQLIAQNPDLLKHFCEFVHEALVSLPEDDTTADIFEFLTHEVQNWEQDWGRPVWLARLDKNSNPSVRSNSYGMFAPFADLDNDGICDVDIQGHPIDQNGNILDIPAFSNQEYQNEQGEILIYRDAEGRALSPSKEFVFNYYDAKHTVLSLLEYQIGQAFQAQIPEDAFKVATKLLGPKITQYDEQGAYLGYSLDSPAAKGLLGTSDLLKREQVHLLLRGCVLIARNQDPEAIQMAILGVWQMIAQEIRDNPNINNPEDLAKWFEGFANNPPQQIFPLLQLMLMTEIPDCPYPNMAMLFFYWISSDYQDLSQNLWPMVQALRDLESQHPGLTDSLVERVITWAKWAFTAKVQNNNQENISIAAYTLDHIVQKLLSDPDGYVEKFQERVKETLPSRRFANLIECLNGFEPYNIFRQVIISFLQPNPDASQDVYSELVRVQVGMIQCRQDIVINLRLVRLLGQFCDPNLPLAENLLVSFQHLATADWNLALLKVARNAVATDTQGKTPIAVFVRAYLDVLQATEHVEPSQQITPQQITCVINHFTAFLLDYDGLLQRVYRVIQKNSSKY